MAGKHQSLPIDLKKELLSTVQQIFAPGKGILACDEPVENIGQRLKNVSLDNTEENRRKYREIFLTTNGIENYISGVILTEEILNQKFSNGELFMDGLKKKNILYGITLDTGLVTSPFSTDLEYFTQGLDKLGDRAQYFKKIGVKFAKWRMAIMVSKHAPTPLLLKANAVALARYASICQNHGIVPIVEPDVCIDGDHSLEEGQKVLESTLSFLYKAMHDYHVYLEATILKTNFVTPGKDSKEKVTPLQVAKATVDTLMRTVPAAVAGIGFLSGGHSPDLSTEYLKAVVKEANSRVGNDGQRKTCLWFFRFCYGRAILNDLWVEWKGKNENVSKAQKIFLERAKANSQATKAN